MYESKGFTLIELVVVIIILGILAAVAVPRFVNLQSEAKTSALQDLKGALASALSTNHAKLVVKDADKQLLNSRTTPKAEEVIEGCSSCSFGFGYPAPDSRTLSTLVNGISLEFEDDFVVTAATALGSDSYHAEITFLDNIDTANKKLLTDACYVRYTMSLVGLTEPTIELVACE